MITACVNEGVLTPATTTPILNEEEQDALHKTLINVAAYAMSSEAGNN